MRVILLLLTALAVLPRPAEADVPVVIELFTSQGCNACPPADDLFAALAARDDVIGIALHVDYWDYLGWTDTFASPANTQRQYGYASALGQRSVYTPQIVVQGETGVIGSRAADVTAAILAASRRELPVAVTLSRQGTELTIVVDPVRPVGAADIHVVGVRRVETVNVLRGENADRRLSYHNIATSWTTLATDWPGSAARSWVADLPETLRAVVLVQTAGHGRILGAAEVD